MVRSTCSNSSMLPLPMKPSKPIDWDSARGDLIRRAYWHCAITETLVVPLSLNDCFHPNNDRGLHLELDLPLTGIIGLADRVGIPSFNSPFCKEDDRGNQLSHFEAHYASQVALRQLCADLHRNINESCKHTTLPNFPNFMPIKAKVRFLTTTL